MENENLLAIANEFGSPVYVYDSSKIISQYDRLSDAFKKVKRLNLIMQSRHCLILLF